MWEVNDKIVGKCTSGRFAKTIFYFLRNNAYSSARTKVTGNKCNLGSEEGIQVPCKLALSGQPKFVSLLRKELNENERNLSSDNYFYFLFLE